MKLSKLNDLIENGEIIKGRWELDDNHEIQYKSQGKDEEIKLKAPIVAAEPGALLVSVTERQSDQKVVTSIARLTGIWRANSKNQLQFEVEKEKGKNDVLTFRSGWKVNDTNELVYTYRETRLKKKTKVTRELAFHGFWDISDKNRLTYWLSRDSDSVFRFRGAFQSQSILAKKGQIRYQLGAELKGKHKLQTITLFGKWKVSHDLDLSFEIEYQDGQKEAITFGAEYALSDDKRIILNLKTQQGEPLGLELILTKDLFCKDGQAFLRLARSLEDSRIEAGVELEW